MSFLRRVLSKMGLVRPPVQGAGVSGINAVNTSTSDALKKAQEDRIKALKAIAAARGLKVSDADIAAQVQAQTQARQQAQTTLTSTSSPSSLSSSTSASTTTPTSGSITDQAHPETNISQAAASSAVYSAELDKMRTLSSRLQEETFQLIMRREELLQELKQIEMEEQNEANGITSATHTMTAQEEEKNTQQQMADLEARLASLTPNEQVIYDRVHAQALQAIEKAFAKQENEHKSADEIAASLINESKLTVEALSKFNDKK